MKPKPNKAVEKLRRQEIEDMKRVQINAQVTAIITVFEFIAHLVLVIIHIVIPPSWIDEIIVATFLLLHFIILPYLFIGVVLCWI